VLGGMTPTLDLASQMFPNLSGISVEGTIWKSSNTPDGTYVLVPPVLTESFNGYHIGFGAAATLAWHVQPGPTSSGGDWSSWYVVYIIALF